MNKAEKTLVILTPGWPADEADTTCLPMQQNLARSLREGYPHINIIILTFQYPYFVRTYNWFGTTVVSFNGQNKGGLSRLLLRPKINLALKKVHDTSEIIGLLSFWCGECAAVGNAFANKHGLKHFCWILGQDAKKENKYPRRLQVKPGNLVALSDFLQEEFGRNHGVLPGFVIPPGIEPKQFGPPPLEKDIEILAAGSLIPLKQYDVFIEVAAELTKKIPQLKAVLIGKGPEREKLVSLISKLGLEKNVLLTGELSYPETLQWMQRAKIFLHPSSYEGFGVVMIEALYAGCHVISFCQPMKVSIPQWHIRSKEEMSNKVIEILNNPGAEDKRVSFGNINDTARMIFDLFTQ